MNVVIFILFIIGLMILFRPSRQPTPLTTPTFPPPALPPGGSWYSRQPGDNCSKADQQAKSECQNKYNRCIDSSLQGQAHFPNCYNEYEQSCLPIINRCK